MVVKFLNMKNIQEKPIFGQNLIRLRKERGLSQQDLANNTGLTKRMISYYENEVVNPPIEKVKILAKALKVSINELLDTKKQISSKSKFAQIDTRTLKKIEQILSLSQNERHMVYAFVESLINKKKQKNKES